MRVSIQTSEGEKLHRVLGRRDLILLFIVAVANLNLVPPIAASGPLALWLWFFALTMFFWPQGAAVTELSQKWPGEGGIYLWAKKSFGEKHGFLAGWTYWLTNVVYLPTVVLSCVGVGLYILGPETRRLSEKPVFTGIVSILVIVGLMLLNIRGLNLGKWVNNIGGLATAAGACVLCGLAILIMRHHTSSLHFTQLRPSGMDWRVLTAFGTICYSLVGLDLASIMGGEIREPKRDLPISILIGGLAAGLIYLGTTISMLVALPQQQIGVLAGILQAISIMSEQTHLTIIIAPLALLECLAILGTASAWFAGAARLPFVAGVDKYLPAQVGRLHPRYGTPYVSLIVFAVMSSLLIVMSFLGVTVGEAYLTLLDLAVILQLLPSAYLFGSLLKHVWRRQSPLHANRYYLLANGGLGMLATLIGLGVAFVPSHLVTSIWAFEFKLVAGCSLVFGAAYFFYQRSDRTSTVDLLAEAE